MMSSYCRSIDQVTILLALNNDTPEKKSDVYRKWFGWWYIL